MAEQRHPQTAAYHEFWDRVAGSIIARSTGGLAPATLWNALADWSIHLASAPGKQLSLIEEASRHHATLWRSLFDPGHDTGLPSDRRFASEHWSRLPYAALRDSFLLTEDWWLNATTGIRGMTPANEAALSFATRQMLDTIAPSNFPFLNPDVLVKARESLGTSLVQGASNTLTNPANAGEPPRPDLAIGTGLAATQGKVVARSHLAELIQYSPTTETVHPEPILIVPAWIMKYYILDLSQQNSLVRWLVAQGHTVFILSWRNPGPQDRDLGMQDYLEQGPRMALDAIAAIADGAQVHAAGYCLGGTLMAIQAAFMARISDPRLASLTLLAAQVDFADAGELALFVSEAQVARLEDMMWHQGYLDGSQMAGAFTMLRSNDLFWSRMIQEQFMGEHQEPNDLMAWNADSTRMPYRMHSEYLRELFLENRLSHGKYRIGGGTLSLTDLDLPIFAVGTERDHVAPWKSVYKIHHLTDADVTFVLTSGGHNAGIVSEPGHKRRHYRIATHPHSERYQDPDAWLNATAPRDGSWWEAWSGWLKERSGGPAEPPQMGHAKAGYPALCDAPGAYIHQK